MNISTRLSLGLALFLWGASALASVSATRKPEIFKITGLLEGTTLPLIAGKTVDLGASLGQGEELLFKDLFPGANWAHDAVIELVKNGQVLRSIPTRLPPRDFAKAWKLENGSFQAPKTAGITFKINNFGGKFKVTTPAHFYALLINGSAEQRHYNDFAFLYRILVQVYGYSPANIFVADSSFIKTAPDLGGDGTNGIRYESTFDAVTNLMTSISKNLKSSDQLLVVTNDHGDLQGGESTLYLHDKEMKASVFVGLLNKIKAGKVLSIHEPCYAGGFVRPSVGSQRVAMSASTNIEKSWSSLDQNFDEFIYHVVAAFGMQTHDGVSVVSDLDANGKISAHEAFIYAVAQDAQPERPVLEDQPDTGYVDSIGIGF